MVSQTCYTQTPVVMQNAVTYFVPMRLASSQVSPYLELSQVCVDLCVQARSEVEARWGYSTEISTGYGTCQRPSVGSAMELVEILYEALAGAGSWFAGLTHNLDDGVPPLPRCRSHGLRQGLSSSTEPLGKLLMMIA